MYFFQRNPGVVGDFFFKKIWYYGIIVVQGYPYFIDMHFHISENTL